jgi:hypothetical protein
MKSDKNNFSRNSFLCFLPAALAQSFVAASCFSHIELSEGQIAAALAPPTPAAGRES